MKPITLNDCKCHGTHNIMGSEVRYLRVGERAVRTYWRLSDISNVMGYAAGNTLSYFQNSTSTSGNWSRGRITKNHVMVDGDTYVAKKFITNFLCVIRKDCEFPMEKKVELRRGIARSHKKAQEAELQEQSKRLQVPLTLFDGMDEESIEVDQQVDSVASASASSDNLQSVLSHQNIDRLKSYHTHVCPHLSFEDACNKFVRDHFLLFIRDVEITRAASTNIGVQIKN
jgi:hypothetical protein